MVVGSWTDVHGQHHRSFAGNQIHGKTWSRRIKPPLIQEDKPGSRMLARPELGNKAFRSVRIVWMAAERD